MNKERLEEIKEKTSSIAEPMLYINWHDVKWLIEQAERVQELEEENRRVRQMRYHEAYEQGKFDTNMKVWYELPKLEQQNKRYREALDKNKVNHERQANGY